MSKLRIKNPTLNKVTKKKKKTYTKTLKHENIRIFEKHAHALGVLLLTL